MRTLALLVLMLIWLGNALYYFIQHNNAGASGYLVSAILTFTLAVILDKEKKDDSE